MKNNIQHIKHTIINGVLLVLLFIIPDNLLAQKNQVTVSGCVTDATGMTLPSTSVTLKSDNKIGVLTNAKGEFTITIPENSTLVFSFVGMKPQEVTIEKKKTFYKIVLEEDNQDLEEVVVTGYQRLKRHEVVGSTYTVKGDDIRIAGVNRLDMALQGLIPGVSITIPSGMIGTAAQVRVRGTSTIVGNASPIWVVDGMIREEPLPFEGQQLNDILSSGDMSSAMTSISESSISGVNPDDIESITFLKDAFAAAIYGVRAANGVIVITTKRGTNTQGRISVNFRSDISITPKRTYAQTDRMNSSERIELSKEIIESGLPFSQFPENTGYEGLYQQLITKRISNEEFNHQVTNMEKRNTDWFDILARNAISQNYTLSLSGGNEKLNFYGSVGYNNSLNSYKGNDQKRKTVTLNVDTKLRENLRTYLKFSANQSITNAYYTGVNPEDYALSTSRILAPDEWYLTNENTPEFKYTENNSTKIIKRDIRYNFLNELKHTGNENKNTNFDVQGNIIWNILPELKWEMTGAFSKTTTTANLWADDHSYAVSKIRGANYGELVTSEKDAWLALASALPYGGILNYNFTEQQSYTFRNQLNYGKTFGKDGVHAINIVLGNEIRSNTYTGQKGLEYGYMPDRGKSIDYNYSTQGIIEYVKKIYPNSNITDLITPDFSERHSTSIIDRVENNMSFYAILGYTFSTKYSISFNLRNDASNRFGENTNNRFNPTWSAGIRWEIGQENFFRQFGWLNALTFRGSYGYQGTAASNVGPDIIAQFNIAPDVLTGEQFLAIKQFANKDLKWEKTGNLNLGIDISLFDNRLFGTVEYYYKKTTDVISPVAIPTENGTTSMSINNGTVINKGYDLAVTIVPLQHKDLRWSISATTSFNRNKIKDNVDIPNLEKITDGSVIVDGYALGSFWSFPYIGLSNEGRPKFAIIDETPGTLTPVSGSLLEYMVYSGVKDPIFSGGLSTSFRYKQFTLGATFNIQLGHHKRLNPFMRSSTSSNGSGALTIPNPEKNASNILTKRWRNPGDEKHTNIPALLAKDEDLKNYLPDNSLSIDNYNATYRYTMYNLSDYRVVKANHLRCNNINVAYAFSRKQLEKTGLSSLVFGLTVTDPFIIKSKGLGKQDPETLSSNANRIIPVVDRQRKFSLSISLGF